jgi:multimeric flavodoxin WrbA
MANILVIYHSQTGNTDAMAKAFSEEATRAGASVTLKRALEANPDDMLRYDIVVFGSPNCFGRMCGLIQDFFERAWAGVGNNAGNIKYTAFTSGGSTQRTALESIDNVVAGFNRMKPLKFTKVVDGIVGSSREQSQALAACRELGKKIAAL